jgi:hypothetical protein
MDKRHRRIQFATLAVAIALLSSCQQSDQTGPSISGRLVDESTKAPIVGVVVRIDYKQDTSITGLEGDFTFDGVPPGTYRLSGTIGDGATLPGTTVQVGPHDRSLTTISVPPFAVTMSNSPHPDSALRVALCYRAFLQGQARARRDIANDQACFLTFGLHRRGSWVDTASGLMIRPIAGCVVNDSIVNTAYGYDDYIAIWVNTKGIPAYSLKKWNINFSDPRSYFEECAAKKATIPAPMNGAPVRSPEGQFELRFDSIYSDYVGRRMPELVIRKDTVEYVASTSLAGIDALEIAWGPPNSNIALIRYSYGGDTSDFQGPLYYEVFDLSNGELLSDGGYVQETDSVWVQVP